VIAQWHIQDTLVWGQVTKRVCRQSTGTLDWTHICGLRNTDDKDHINKHGFSAQQFR
jgi:hypothetical protein